MKVLAADIGGTRLKAGLVEDGKILASGMAEVDPQEDFSSLMEKLSLLLESLSNRPDPGPETAGEGPSCIGIALPGLVDSHRNRMLDINEKLSDSKQFDFNHWAEERWGLPLVTENDARAALLGSWQYGAGKGCDNLVMVTLGTGVGTAAIVEGRMLRGRHFQAGNLGGHFTVSLEGPLCNCGNVGCVEALGSTWALKKSRTKESDPADFEGLFRRYREGDPVSLRRGDEILKAWAAGTVNLIHAFDPEKIVFSGGVMRSADIILPFISDWVKRHAWLPWGRLELLSEQDPEEIALLGLGWLAMNKLNL